MDAQGATIAQGSTMAQDTMAARFWQRVDAWDKHVSEAMHVGGWQHASTWRAGCRVLEFGGHGLPWFLLVAVLLTEAVPNVPASVPANLFLALLGDIACVGALKGVFRRARPAYNQCMMLDCRFAVHVVFKPI